MLVFFRPTDADVLSKLRRVAAHPRRVSGKKAEALTEGGAGRRPP